jgi:hypothetical protein
MFSIYIAVFRKPNFSEAAFERRAGHPTCIIYIIHSYQEVQAMFENPVAKRTAIAAAIGAVIAIPVPFVGPLFGAVVGAGVGFFTAKRGG